MSTLKEIEDAIGQLPAEQFHELLQRMVLRSEQERDRELEEDANSGKLKRLYARLKSEDAGEPEIPLDDFLDHSELS